ncbi:hypothetical protein TNCV_2497672 [Trichonephila clavipes]|nr:hypothetical protein TNCV_2497672 [Trichonephila clavipes]
MIGIVFKASADIGEKFAKFCNPADCHPPVSFPSPLLKKCSLFNDFPKTSGTLEDLRELVKRGVDVYTNNLNKNLSLFDYHPNNIQNSTDIDNKIKNFTSTILATHSHAYRPIGNQHRSYTPPHIHQLIQLRNRLRKQYHRTLSPAHKTELNRTQQLAKNTLKQYSIHSWNQRLSALSTQDNSLWHSQKLFKNKRQAIPPLECYRGTAITDTQKANLLAGTLKENFTESTYQNTDTENHINNTVNTFISTNPTTYPVLPDEIITYIKNLALKKHPPDGHGYELVSSVRAMVPQKFSVEEELMHVKHVKVKSPHVGVMWKFGRRVIISGIILLT